jgi:predicted AlkP superfamily phosphohydrolase/phosphomutase
MVRLNKKLDPTQTGQDAEKLYTDLHKRIVGQNEAIDHIGHDFMAFHPPRMEHVRPDLFEAFQGVMNATYEFHDQMLGRLLELAGPEAHVMIVSDHGFSTINRGPDVIEIVRLVCDGLTE